MSKPIEFLKSAILVIAAYLLCHGVTAWMVTPVQSYFLDDLTIFASLIYLPHGVRVLSVWLLGWRAALPLALGAFLSELMFTSVDIREMMQGVLPLSIGVGVLSAYSAFAIFRVAGVEVSFSGGAQISWRRLLGVGAVASVLNSLGQAVVFSNLLSTKEELSVIGLYFVGDLLGQVLLMLALMVLFRSMRLSDYETSQ